MNSWQQKRARLEEKQELDQHELERILDDEQQLLFDTKQEFNLMMEAFYHYSHDNSPDPANSNNFDHISAKITQEFQQKQRQMQQIMEETATSKRELKHYYNGQMEHLLQQEQLEQQDKNRNN